MSGTKKATGGTQTPPPRRKSHEQSGRPTLVQTSPARSSTPSRRLQTSVSESPSQLAAQMMAQQSKQSQASSEESMEPRASTDHSRRQSSLMKVSPSKQRITVRDMSGSPSSSPTPSDNFLLARLRAEGSRTTWSRRESEQPLSAGSQQQLAQRHPPKGGRRLEAFMHKLTLSLWHARIIIIVLGCLGQTIIHGLKYNMTASLNTMINHTAVKKSGHLKSFNCPDMEPYPDGPFVWGDVTERMMMNGYLYGYMGSHIAGAILSERFGGKWIAFASVVISALCSVVMPSIATHAEWDMLVLMLMVQGAAGGLYLPAIMTLISHWSPPSHRTIFCGVIFGGEALGKVLSLSLNSFARNHGWEYLFHFMVVIMLPWAVLWGLWAHSTPFESFFVRNPRGQTAANHHRHAGILQFPILQIKNSMPAWALVVSSLGYGCGFYMVMTQIPRFSRIIQVIHKEEYTGFHILPYILMFLVSLSLGFIIDYLRLYKGLPTEIARKAAASVAMVIPAGCIVGMSLTECNSALGVALFTIGVAAAGAFSVSIIVNHLDITPNFASMFIALTNILQTIPHVIIPTVLAYKPTEGNTPDTSAIVIAAIYVSTFLFFAMFASGHVQTWNYP